MPIQDIVKIITQLSIVEASSLLSIMTDSSDHIKKVSQILLQLPLDKVYSIIPTMTVEPSNISISIIVSILLNMPISTIALIIANMNIPQIEIIPIIINTSSIIDLQKAIILSDPSMPIEKAALILSDPNIPECQAASILSNMNKDKSSAILSKMTTKQAALILSSHVFNNII
jgi:hypothetical protein